LTQNPEPRTQNPKPKTQNPKPKTQNPIPNTQNAKLKTDPKPITQNPDLEPTDLNPTPLTERHRGGDRAGGGDGESEEKKEKPQLLTLQPISQTLNSNP
jgi:hypothetical protein